MGSKGVVTHSTELSSIICKRHCLDDLTGGGEGAGAGGEKCSIPQDHLDLFLCLEWE